MQMELARVIVVVPLRSASVAEQRIWESLTFSQTVEVRSELQEILKVRPARRPLLALALHAPVVLSLGDPLELDISSALNVHQLEHVWCVQAQIFIDTVRLLDVIQVRGKDRLKPLLSALRRPPIVGAARSERLLVFVGELRGRTRDDQSIMVLPETGLPRIQRR